MNIKKTFNNLLEYVPKNKRNYLFILTVLFLISIYVVIKYCDSPVFSFLPEVIKGIFIKPPNADMTWYNLGISYIVSYMFYVLVSFIPDYLTYKEIVSNRVRLRLAIHREIQLFTVRYIRLWETIFKTAIELKAMEIETPVTIENLFTLENIEKSANVIQLSRDAGVHSFNGTEIDWYTHLVSEFRAGNSRGNEILTRYKDELPTNIFYNIFYLINDSSLFKSNLIEAMASIHRTRCFFLGNTMDVSGDHGKDIIKESCNCIIELVNWVNKEYNYLKAENISKSIFIYPIEISIK